jgi:hypothetical protein
MILKLINQIKLYLIKRFGILEVKPVSVPIGVVIIQIQMRLFSLWTPVIANAWVLPNKSYWPCWKKKN